MVRGDARSPRTATWSGLLGEKPLYNGIGLVEVYIGKSWKRIRLAEEATI